MMAFSMIAMVSCGDDKKDEDKDGDKDGAKKEAAAEAKIEFPESIHGAWKIVEKDENAGIDGSVIFTFSKDKVVLNSGTVVLSKDMISADDKSFSYKDVGDTPWHFNYTLDGDHLLLDNMYNGSVHAKYKLARN